MLNLLQRTALGQGAILSVPNSQLMNAGKAINAESRSGATSQPCRGVKLALCRGQERHKS
jgi:hypothetical protein